MLVWSLPRASGLIVGVRMHILVSRARAVSPEAAREACRVFGHLLSLHQEPGFVYGACTISVNDPQQLLFYSRWGNLAALQGWLSSEEYRQTLVQAIPRLVSPPHDEVFEICGE